MQRAPQPSLARFIKSVWLSEPATSGAVGILAREQMMPTGEMHLVVRLCGPAIRIFSDADAAAGLQLGHAVVGGARARFYAKDVSFPSQAIGVQLLPGAAQALLGMPADELTGQHVQLEAIWGPEAGLMREQLLAAHSPADKLRTFEGLLNRRLEAGQARSVHPAVMLALQHFKTGIGVEEAVRLSGYSHTQFIRVFSQAVGLTPKLYCRVQRFQHALKLMRRTSPAGPLHLAAVAVDAGYSDQPHFNREFREFSGLTPEQYRAARSLWVNHVSVPVPPTTNQPTR